MNVAFWNLNRKPLIAQVVKLAELHETDVLPVAESRCDAGDILSELNRPQAMRRLPL
jgi:hypothetical protein